MIQTNDKIMDKTSVKYKIMLSLTALSILCLCPLMMSCAWARGPSSTPAKPPPSEPAEGVYLSPLLIEAHPGDEITIEIKVKPSGWGVSGCEVNLDFDPDIMEALAVEPGTFLGDTPLVGINRIDNQSGWITLALARVGVTSVPSPAGVLATATFKVLDSAKSGSYELDLTKAGLANEDFQDVTQFTVQGTIINISS